MLETTWSRFKNYANLYPNSVQYITDKDNNYNVYVSNDEFEVFCRVAITTPKNADQIDFETNFLPNANKPNFTKIVGSSLTGQEQFPVASTSDGRLKVESLPASGTSIIPSLGTNLYYDDMNADTGGVARNTVIDSTWTTLYDSNLAPVPGNSGLMISFILTLEKIEETDPGKSWFVRMIIDGVEVFGSSGIRLSDVTNKDLYGFILDPNKNIPEWGGLTARESSFQWEGPINLPITYNSRVRILARKESDFKAFRAGLVILTKV